MVTRPTRKITFEKCLLPSNGLLSHHHEAVEDGEPVDPVLEKVGVKIFVEAILKLYV